LLFDPNGMLSATNVALGRSDGFIGVGNPIQSVQFGTTTLGAGFVASTVQTVNNAPLSVQGYLGGAGVQARITTLLNGTRTPSINYTYIDAAHGFNDPQTQTAVAPTTTFPDGNVGSVAVWSIPTGQIVLSVEEVSATGTATSGVYVYEATALRDY